MDEYRKALAVALARSETDIGIAGEPMMAAVAHAQRVASMEAKLGKLRAAAKLAHHEMRNTVAPRNSFTDALDALDAALTA